MNIIKLFGMLAIMLALTGMVIAETNESDTNSTELTNSQALIVRYDHLQCKVEFTNTQIDILNEYISTLNQTENKEKLLEDMNELKAFVEEINKTEFDRYVTEILSKDLKKASEDLTVAKRNFKQYNLSNETKTEITTQLKDAKEAYSKCISDKEIKMSKVMEKHMENWNKQLEKIMEKMNKKNITTENMTAIINEINERNEKLQELINAGNITTIREFMKEYHISQFNYATRFEIARLNGYKEKLGPLAEKYNMSDKIKDINEKINHMEKYKYNDSENKKIWEDIKETGKDIKDAAKEINDERLKERSEKINERQQKIEDKITQRDQRMPPGQRGNNMEDKIENESEDN
jgi:hypothetical protein